MKFELLGELNDNWIDASSTIRIEMLRIHKITIQTNHQPKTRITIELKLAELKDNRQQIEFQLNLKCYRTKERDFGAENSVQGLNLTHLNLLPLIFNTQFSLVH